MSRPDVAVVGLGPAGRALAHRLLARGASVVAIDPHPERVWRHTYAGWADQLPSWLGPGVVGARCARTALRACTEHRLPGEYTVLDTAGLQQSLDLTGAVVRAGLLGDDEMRCLAPVVVDCRGSWALGEGAPDRDVPRQTAHGVVLAREAVTALLQSEDAVLMDWRPFHSESSWGDASPSFLYLVPLAEGRVLAEETCLAGSPALPPAELRRRLHVRLRRHGVSSTLLAGADTEVVHIPLRSRPTTHGLPRFGAAGPQLNPISGYSVFASLRDADSWAESLLTTGAPPAAEGAALRNIALEALLRLGAEDTRELFEGFGRLTGVDQRAVLDPSVSTRTLVGAMSRQWLRMSTARKPALVSATLAGLPRALAGLREAR